MMNRSIILAALLAQSANHAAAFAPAAIGRNSAMARVSMSEVGTDVSIDYDAAAKLAYSDWCAKYGKDGSTFAQFKENYEALTVANVMAARKSQDDGTDRPKDLEFNEYADMAEEDYMAMMSGEAPAESAVEVEEEAPQKGALESAVEVEATTLKATYTPIFDFTTPNSTTKSQSASSFERIDDAIMGGISLSSLRDVVDKPYASWSGVCRTDGGGFCGMRTLPFADAPLNATGMEGVYLDAKLASDDEADKRVWKMTVRTDTSRGEMVYQCEYDLKRAMDEAKKSDGEGWARVLVPFDEFQLVRGPRLVPDGPKLDATGGIFQIGMTLSKFVMGQNTTELENFRPGYFDMHIQRIGFYNKEGVVVPAEKTSTSNVPETLTKKEAEGKRPLLLKMLLPVAKVFFSEKANRRKSAMRILREERDLSRGKAILFGVRARKHSMGLVPSVMKTLGILSIDSLRTVVKNVLKIVFLYPLRIVGALVRKVKLMLGMKVKPSLRE